MPALRRPRTALAVSLPVAALAASLAAPAADALTPAWQQTEPFGAPRNEPALAPLPDGDVLAAGGYRGGPANLLASAERYDVATGSWTPAGSLAEARYGATATVLADGRVLVAGGFTNVDWSERAEIYDPATNTWSAAAPLATARTDAAAARLGDGRVLVTGGVGSGGELASAELYDPATNTWSAAAPLPAARSEHTATALPDGSVAVVGGSVSGTRLADALRYDPAADAWRALPSLPSPRGRHSALALADGTLLVAGGFDASGLNDRLLRLAPGAAAWTSIPLGMTAYDAGLVPLRNGTVLVAGTQARVWDPVSGRVAPLGAPPAVVNSTAVALDGGALLVGGFNTNGAPARLDPAATVTTGGADFGEVTTGRRSAVIDVPVEVNSEFPLLTRATAIEGAHAGDFAIVSDGCSGRLLAGGESCFVGVRFTPSADGSRGATLTMSASELPGGRQQIALSGSGVPAPTSPAPGPAPVPPAPAPVARDPAARRAAATPHIRCGSRRVARRVVCTGLPRTLGRGSVRLSRGGIVHATGTLRNGRLTLTVRRRLFDRRYTLVVGGRRTLKVVLD